MIFMNQFYVPDSLLDELADKIQDLFCNKTDKPSITHSFRKILP